MVEIICATVMVVSALVVGGLFICSNNKSNFEYLVDAWKERRLAECNRDVQIKEIDLKMLKP